MRLFSECRNDARGMLDQVLKADSGPFLWLTITTDDSVDACVSIKRGWYEAALLEPDEAERLQRLWNLGQVRT
jgi:hypothetical protein